MLKERLLECNGYDNKLVKNSQGMSKRRAEYAKKNWWWFANCYFIYFALALFVKAQKSHKFRHFILASLRSVIT